MNSFLLGSSRYDLWVLLRLHCSYLLLKHCY
jgi:hypothetical protein